MAPSDNFPTVSLALSDIIHQMSPSPGPAATAAPGEQYGTFANPLTNGSSNTGYGLPSTLFESESARVRKRLEEMGFSVANQRDADGNMNFSTNTFNGSSRERELVNMLIRLTDTLPVDPTQLDRQAEVISGLRIQRDYIASQAQEDREKWDAERATWDRTAEALLSQRQKVVKIDENERMRTMSEAENKSLRDKLQLSQRRLTLMENELLRLKPMLLMQPSSGSSHQSHKGKSRQIEPTRTPALSTIPEEQSNAAATPNRKDTWKISVPSPSTASTMKLLTNPPTLPPPPSVVHVSAQPEAPTSSSAAVSSTATTAAAASHKRRSRDHHHGKRQSRTISANASLEFILVAAKRLGRKHVARVAGLAAHIEREKELLALEQEQIKIWREQDRLEAERQERTAGGGKFGQYYRSPGAGPEAGAMSPPPNPTPQAQRPSTSGGGHATSSAPPPGTPKRMPYSNAIAGPSGTGAVNHGSNDNSTATTSVNTSNSNSNNDADSPLVYVNVHTPASQNGMGSPWGAGSGVIGTPKQIRSALHHHQRSATSQGHSQNHGHNNSKAGTSNPPTPLASLLDVALRMDMDDDEDDARERKRQMKGKSTHGVGGGGAANEHKRSRPLEEPESPVPAVKRRKVLGPGGGPGASATSGSAIGSGSGSKNGPVGKHVPATINSSTSSNSNSKQVPSTSARNINSSAPSTFVKQSGQKLERMKSALDVLADQADQAAAAFIDPDVEQSRRVALLTSRAGAGTSSSAKAKPQPQSQAQVAVAKVKGSSAKGKARADTDNADDVEPPKKKRGRPPKRVVGKADQLADKDKGGEEMDEEDELVSSVEDSISASVSAPPIRTITASSRGRPRTRGGSMSAASASASTSASASASAEGATTAKPTLKPIPSVVVTTSSRGRPIRHASRKLAAMSPNSPPTKSTRARGRPRGSTKVRSKANPNAKAKTSAPASASASVGEARVIMPPPAPRIIAHGPGYSPLDEAIALSSSSSRSVADEGAKQQQQHNSQSHPRHADSHPQSTHHYHSMPGTTRPATLMTSPSLNLRPVVAWGNNNTDSDNATTSTPATASYLVSGGNSVRTQRIETPPPPPFRAVTDSGLRSPLRDGEKTWSPQVLADDDETRESREVSSFLTAPGTPSTPARPTTVRRPHARGEQQEEKEERLQEDETRQQSAPLSLTLISRSVGNKELDQDERMETPMAVDSPPPSLLQVATPMAEPPHTPTPPSQTTEPALSPVVVVTERVSTTPIPEDENITRGDVDMSNNGGCAVAGNLSPTPMTPSATARRIDDDPLQSPPIVVIRRVATPVHVQAGGVEEDIDADADVEMAEGHDIDAEGEEEEDEKEQKEGDENTETNSSDKPPDPPAPPPGGAGNGGDALPPHPPDQDEGHDPDADAEGEMEFEENEHAPGPVSGSSSLAHHLTMSKLRSRSAVQSSKTFVENNSLYTTPLVQDLDNNIGVSCDYTREYLDLAMKLIASNLCAHFLPNQQLISLSCSTVTLPRPVLEALSC